MVLGSDNEDFLSFAHHTQGIDVRWFCGQPDLSESPVAYKNAEQVRAQIEHFGLAKVVAQIRPLGCIMAGNSGRSWKQIKEEELTPKQKRQIVHRADRRRTKQGLGRWRRLTVEAQRSADFLALPY